MVEFSIKELEKKIELIEKKEQESKSQATDRISEELKGKRIYEEKRDVVFNYFFELTGQPMTMKQFEKYIEKFNKAEPGYNIWKFILDEKIKIDERIKSMGYEEFIEQEPGIDLEELNNEKTP